MSEDLLKILFNYFTDEEIINHINSNIKNIDLELVIYLTLNYKRFGLLKKIFDINKNIMNKTIFENNISIYTKNINDKNIIASVYSWCIRNLGFKIKKNTKFLL